MAAVILRILLFILPFILFYYLMRYLKRRKEAGDEGEIVLEDNIGTGALVGIVALIAFIVFMAFSGGGGRGADYQPPKEVDGEIQPGKLTDKDN